MSSPQIGASPFETVVFDLDGTLIDSAPGMTACMQSTLEAMSLSSPPRSDLRRFIGPPMKGSFVSLGVPPSDAGHACALYFDAYDTTGWTQSAVFDGIPKVLTTLRRSNPTLAIATSKRNRFATRLLRALGLHTFFDAIGTAADDGSRDSKRDVISYKLRELNIEPIESADGGTPHVLMVGDRIHDVAGASHWGIPTMIARWGYGDASEFSDESPSVAIPGDLPIRINRLSL